MNEMIKSPTARGAGIVGLMSWASLADSCAAIEEKPLRYMAGTVIAQTRRRVIFAVISCLTDFVARREELTIVSNTVHTSSVGQMKMPAPLE